MMEQQQQVFVALDIEGLGEDKEKYPTVAVAFVVLNRQGQVLQKWQTYMPYDVCEATIEPACYREFWNNPKKCDPKVFAHLVNQCRNSPHRNMADAWRAVADEIDRIYEKFGSVTWVTDCADYDVALVSHFVGKYAQRAGLRYNQAGIRHRVVDCSSGMYVIRKIFPVTFTQYQATLEKSGAPAHTHDCLDDATRLGVKYIQFLDTVDQLQQFKH